MRYKEIAGGGQAPQYSSLENPMDSRARQATVHGAASSRMWVSDTAQLSEAERNRSLRWIWANILQPRQAPTHPPVLQVIYDVYVTGWRNSCFREWLDPVGRNRNLTEVFFLCLENECPVTLWSKISEQGQQYTHTTGWILRHKRSLFTDKHRFSGQFVQERDQKLCYVRVQTAFEKECL